MAKVIWSPNSLDDIDAIAAYNAVYLDLSLHTGFPIATLDGDLKTAALKAGVAIV